MTGKSAIRIILSSRSGCEVNRAGSLDVSSNRLDVNVYGFDGQIGRTYIGKVFMFCSMSRYVSSR